MTSPQDSTPAARLRRDLGTIPNLLSLSRVVLTPAALVAYGLGSPDLVLWLLLASAFVDIADGYVARKLDQCTELGAILDRATDLMMESVALFVLIGYGILPFWAYFVYLFREFIVTSARMYMAEIDAPIPKSALGQRKTNLLMGGFGVALGSHIEAVPFGSAVFEVLYPIGVGGLIGGLVLSYLSMGQYLFAFAKSYRGH